MFVVALLLLAEFMVECSSFNESASFNECQLKYLRLSPEHTMCIAENKNCKIYKRGVTEDDIKLILATHNELRNKVACGDESKAGGMPKAANMLQMVWDEELALEAQKLAEQCKLKHDCQDCRAVEEYQVGQNIGIMLVEENNTMYEKDWKKMINTFYDEFNYFDKSVIESYAPGEINPVTRYGYMTQVIWAKTWRVGCGWILYDGEKQNASFYVCNYGPTGNVVGKTVYKKGKPCSKCPKNTCCGDKCSESGIQNEYPSLCKIIDETSAPETAPAGNYIFFCAFNGESDCTISEKKGEIFKTVGGNWLRLILQPGGNESLEMDKSFKSFKDDENLCFNVVLRVGNFAGTGPSEVSSTIVFQHDDENTQSFKLKPWHSRFTFSSYDFDLQLPRGDENKVSMRFSVTSELSAQVIDIKQLSVKRGTCDRLLLIA